MENLVEQIAKEVMQKLKSQTGNRGGAYTPPPTSETAPRARSGRLGVLVTANFKVVDQVLKQLAPLFPQGGKLFVSSYLLETFGVGNVPSGVELVSAQKIPAHQALQDIQELMVPSLSMNTLSKAANLMADSYASQILSFALCEGIPITVCDESLLDAARYFPAGVARKIDGFRRDLEGMGVRFQRCQIKVQPEHKCVVCASPTGCTSCQPGTTPQPVMPAHAAPAPTTDCLRENCPRTYGSCPANCSGSVKQIVQAGADRIEKGLEAPVPPAELARYIDHTLLKATATVAEVTKLCEEARQYTFASVCVNPGQVALAAKLLKGTPVKVCTVVGFPLGATSTFTKVMETRDCVANGAGEIDMVINVGALKSKDYELVKNDIARVVEAAGGCTTKVILETSLLNEEEKIKGCELSKLAGADFVKTSTGFSTGGATAEDIALMRRIVGPGMGVKASGGIRDTATAQQMIAAGATRIGASASVGIVKGETAAAAKGY